MLVDSCNAFDTGEGLTPVTAAVNSVEFTGPEALRFEGGEAFKFCDGVGMESEGGTGTEVTGAKVVLAGGLHAEPESLGDECCRPVRSRFVLLNEGPEVASEVGSNVPFAGTEATPLDGMPVTNGSVVLRGAVPTYRLLPVDSGAPAPKEEVL